jgi:hypothetical protein
VGVLLLLALAWAAILVPPAARASAARKEAFLISFDGRSGLGAGPPVGVRRRSARVQRRRRIAGGLLTATAITLGAGLLPTFRVLLVVHLFLLDSFIAYIALLAHAAERAARARRRDAVPAPAPEPVAQGVARGRRSSRRVGPSSLPELAPAPLA